MNLFFWKKKVKIYPIVFSKSEKLYENLSCLICLEKYNHYKVILPCGHNFHNDCIMNWFDKEKSCPICRIKFNYKIK